MKLFLLICFVASMPTFTEGLIRVMGIPQYTLEAFGRHFNFRELLPSVQFTEGFHLPNGNFYRINTFSLAGEDVQFFGSENFIRRSILKQSTLGDHRRYMTGLPRGRHLEFRIVQQDGNWVRLGSNEDYMRQYGRNSKLENYFETIEPHYHGRAYLTGYKLGDKIVLSDQFVFDRATPKLTPEELKGFKMITEHENPTPKIFAYDTVRKKSLAVTGPPLFNENFGVFDPKSNEGIDISPFSLVQVGERVGNIQRYQTASQVEITKFVKRSPKKASEKDWTEYATIFFLADVSTKDRIHLQGIDIDRVQIHSDRRDLSGHDEIMSYFKKVNEEYFHYKPLESDEMIENTLAGSSLRSKSVDRLKEELKDTSAVPEPVNLIDLDSPKAKAPEADLISLDSPRAASTQKDIQGPQANPFSVPIPASISNTQGRNNPFLQSDISHAGINHIIGNGQTASRNPFQNFGTGGPQSAGTQPKPALNGNPFA